MFHADYIEIHESINSPDPKINKFAGKPVLRDIFIWLCRASGVSGTFVTSIAEISKKTVRSASKCRKAVSDLTSLGLIEANSTNSGTKISIIPNKYVR